MRKSRKDYLAQIDALKNKYKQQTGKSKVYRKSLVKIPEFKEELRKIEKNLYNFEQRKKRAEIRRKAEEASKKFRSAKTPDQAQEAAEFALPDSVIQTICFNEPYHLVLSYGGKVERAIEDAIEEGQRMGFNVKVVLEHKGYGRKRVYQSRLAVTIGFQKLYMDLLQIQDDIGDSAGVTISAFSQDKGGERIITVQTNY